MAGMLSLANTSPWGERLNDKKMNRARNSHVEEGLPSVTMMKSVKTRKSGGGTILRLAYDI